MALGSAQVYPDHRSRALWQAEPEDSGESQATDRQQQPIFRDLPADFVGSLAEIEGNDSETECPHGIASGPDQLHGGQHDAEKSRIQQWRNLPTKQTGRNERAG